MTRSVVVAVDDQSQISEARIVAAAFARRQGFDETGAGRVAIVASEAATNIVKHAGRGWVALRGLGECDGGGVELLAVDRGPGMTNIARSLEDGYSSAGSPGTGLGAIVRLSSFFDIFSAPGLGTALVARFRAHPSRPAQAGAPPVCPFEIGAVSAPKPGEEVSGDAWSSRQGPGWISLLLADGLGHGPLAADASLMAVSVFERGQDRSVVEAVERVHAALGSTRGAAIAVAQIDTRAGTLAFCGIGNIAGAILAEGETRHLVSMNGTVGHTVRKIQGFTYEWPSAALLTLASDGIGTHWNLEAYPGLNRRDPSLVAAVLFRDFRRQRDDATLVVAREGRPLVA